MVNHVANSPRRVDKTAVLRFSAHGLRIDYGESYLYIYIYSQEITLMLFRICCGNRWSIYLYQSFIQIIFLFSFFPTLCVIRARVAMRVTSILQFSANPATQVNSVLPIKQRRLFWACSIAFWLRSHAVDKLLLYPRQLNSIWDIVRYVFSSLVTQHIYSTHPVQWNHARFNIRQKKNSERPSGVSLNTSRVEINYFGAFEGSLLLMSAKCLSSDGPATYILNINFVRIFWPISNCKEVAVQRLDRLHKNS